MGLSPTDSYGLEALRANWAGLTANIEEQEMSLAPPKTVYRRLHQLTTTLHVFKSRVEFVVLAFKYGVVSEITSYELWDRGYEGLGERQFDSCFEMGDSEEVIAELIRTARKEGFIDNVRNWCGNESFASWCSYADRQSELF